MRIHFAGKKGLPPDHRLCTDGLIIRAQATIRADGRRPPKPGDGVRAACGTIQSALVFADAARANHVQIFRIRHPENLNAVSG
jgi:hypothetical protein